jgi:hypothetical protein
MNGRKFSRRHPVGFLVLLGVLICPLPGWGEEFDITCCGSTNNTLLSTSPDLVLLGYEGKGISTSNQANKIFDNLSWQVVGMTKVVDGKAQWNEYRKYQDLNGDIFYVELSGVGPEGTYRILNGTGKYKGIKGEAKTKTTARGKSIVPGTGQYCGRAVGTFELAK